MLHVVSVSFMKADLYILLFYQQVDFIKFSLFF